MGNRWIQNNKWTWDSGYNTREDAEARQALLHSIGNKAYKRREHKRWNVFVQVRK